MVSRCSVSGSSLPVPLRSFWRLIIVRAVDPDVQWGGVRFGALGVRHAST
jgi:hypothetical protein